MYSMFLLFCWQPLYTVPYSGCIGRTQMMICMRKMKPRLLALSHADGLVASTTLTHALRA
jgi:hypothetical protein